MHLAGLSGWEGVQSLAGARALPVAQFDEKKDEEQIRQIQLNLLVTLPAHHRQRQRAWKT